VGFAKK